MVGWKRVHHRHHHRASSYDRGSFLPVNAPLAVITILRIVTFCARVDVSPRDCVATTVFRVAEASGYRDYSYEKERRKRRDRVHLVYRDVYGNFCRDSCTVELNLFAS